MFKALCPLCKDSGVEYLGNFLGRDYYRCNGCNLAFVSPSSFLSPAEEVFRYDKHNNTADSPGYVKYLEEVAGYLSKIPVRNPSILDFGCYKTQVLVSILTDRGYDCKGYDPCYKVGLSNLTGRYDVLILCEVLEHLYDINKEIDLMANLLNLKTGYILIRTELYSKDKDVSKWWYTNDETHVFLPSEHTIALIGKRLNREIIYSDGRRYIILGPASDKEHQYEENQNNSSYDNSHHYSLLGVGNI